MLFTTEYTALDPTYHAMVRGDFFSFFLSAHAIYFDTLFFVATIKHSCQPLMLLHMLLCGTMRSARPTS